MGCPEDRCGFTLDPEEVLEDWDGDVEEFYEEHKAVTCTRDVWREGRCIWHAEVHDKPLKALQAARTGHPERLDGAYLVGADVGDKLSFQRCILCFADFSYAELAFTDFVGADLQHTQFADADLQHTQFNDTNLDNAQFPNASLPGAQFNEATLSGARFPDATLPGTEFSDAYLWETKFPNAFLGEAQFPNASLIEAQFPDADLWGAQFPAADLRRVQFHNADLREALFLKTRLRGAQFDGASLHEAQFPGSHLNEAQFPDSDLREARFPDADLRGAKFPAADIIGAEFPDANLRGAQFSDADLSGADCTDATAVGADFTHATLHDTLLIRTDCRGATFTGSLLYETVFSDTRINSQTTFYNPIRSRPVCAYEENPSTSDDLPDETHPLEAAEWVYRRLETLHEENALSEEAREFHISKEEARRAYQREQGEYARYAVSTLQWHLSRHGESIKQIFLSAAVLILACGVLYPFVGGFESTSNGEAYRIPLTELSSVVSWNGVATLFQSLYFSVITFTTIGYGDLAPTGAGSKILVGFESLSGAILIALFVFVLGRRVAR